MRVEALDRLQAPGLPFAPLGLAPPIGFQSGARINRAPALATSTVAARLIDIEEERLLDRVLVRPGLDEHAVLKKMSAARSRPRGCRALGHVVKRPFVPEWSRA